MSLSRLSVLALAVALVVVSAWLVTWQGTGLPKTAPPSAPNQQQPTSGMVAQLPIIAPGPTDAASTARAAITTPAKPPPTLFFGTVVRRADQKPVEGCKVMVFLHSMTGPERRKLSAEEREPWVAWTDAKGKFELELELAVDTEWRGSFYVCGPGLRLVQLPILGLESGRKLDFRRIPMLGPGAKGSSRLGTARVGARAGNDFGFPFGPPAEMEEVWRTMTAMGTGVAKKKH